MERYRVFYLDDDEDDIELFLLATENFDNLQVIVFTDGHAMMKKLHFIARIPNALFVDIHMPKKSGLDIVQDVRQFERFSAMPIIILSGISYHDIDRLRKFGANYFVIKPVTVDKLRRTLKHVFDIDFSSFVPTMENFVLKDIDSLAL